MIGAIKLNVSAVRQTAWHEYAVRFGLGGLATVLAGAVAKFYGPETGGLFLAFPAIFCASATLIERHERRRKHRAGLKGAQRGKDAAALDASGAALGGIGLASFGAVVWLSANALGWLALPLAVAAWGVVSFAAWRTRRWLQCRRKPETSAAASRTIASP